MGTFSELASALEEVRKTPGKNEKVRILSELLRRLPEDEVGLAARFATGRPSTKGSADETQIGYSIIIDVIVGITGANSKQISESFLRHGDLGEVVQELFSGTKRQESTLFMDEELSVAEVGRTFDAMTRSKGKGSTATKRGYLRALLARSNYLEAKYVIKILTREMRIGLVDGLVEEAVAKAFGLPSSEVRSAHLLLGDVAKLAVAARRGEISMVRLELLRPTNFMLAEPMQSAEEVASYFGRELYAEYKYDGIRVQIHKRGELIRMFSRRLEDVTSSFPEIVNGAREIEGHDFIADGEVVPFKDGKPLSFQLLQRRLRKLEGFSRAQADAPVVYFCFDILLLDGRDLYRQPLEERREMLSRIIRDKALQMAEMKPVTTAQQIQERFRYSRSLGYEGLVLKDPESPYTPGKRGKFWVKLKEELDTLDVVIVAAEFGHGKRAGRISDYTFAVKDGDSLKIIGKAYSGLTDKEIAEMMERIKALTLVDQGYRRTVKPELVIEVAFDSVQRSDRHDSGFALRFPRIKRVRDDKTVSQIDTLERVREIYQSQTVKL